ncbi:MAG: putative LPS assembly protein LptD, partial [Sphingobacteriales bacterium]|nr:putative LPS assembly protein LptD [Sphingobacteriales bacterium]
VQAIRHEIRPSIGLNYKPDMNARNFYTIQTDTTGRTAQFNYFERSILGSFSSGRFGGMNFGIDNVLQMKYKNGKDTAQEAQKISLLDGLSINGAYNFLKDSFQLEFLQVAARTNLLNKLSITASAIFDPYITNGSGIRTKKLIWTKTPISLGRLVSGQVSLDSKFNGGDKQTSNNKQQTTNNNQQTGMPMDEYQQEAAYIQKNASEFADFSIPWSVSFSYSLRFFRNLSPTNPTKFTTTINQDFNWNGDMNLTPKWKIGMSGSYNISLKELGVLSMNLSRDLHCWQMQVSVSPVGRYKFFTINISPKSSLLRDIKVNRTRYFYDL